MPALQQLHNLWFRPGKTMANGWWSVTKLESWHTIYSAEIITQPILDKLIRERLGHQMSPPPLSVLSSELLYSRDRYRTLCISLGLWGLRAGQLLRLKVYREPLSQLIEESVLSQLQTLLPQPTQDLSFTPETLGAMAENFGAAWLEKSEDPLLRLSRLWSEPANVVVTLDPPDSILKKLLRWI